MKPFDSHRSPARRPEAELIVRVIRLFADAGYRISREVPNMGQSVDIVAQTRREVITIEVKRSDWKRALDQCRAHRSVADFICVAIGSSRVSPQLSEAATRLNYGIIHCPPGSNECVWVTRPKRNYRVWEPQRQFFKRRILELENGN
jgi:hypothetical protein